MIRISELEVRELISSLFGIDIKISKFNYYLIGSNINEFKLISYSKNSLELDFDQIYSIGIPIIEKIKNQFILLPGILSCILELPTIQVNKEDTLKISYNLPVKIYSDNGLYIIIDELDRRISLGEVQEGIFTPIVDLGYYLRSEK